MRDFTLITCSVYLLALWFLLSSTPWWRSWYQSWALQSSHLLQYLPNMFPWGPEAQKLSAMIIIVSYQWWPYSQLQLLTCLKQLTGAPTVLLLQIYCPQSKLSPATTDRNNNSFVACVHQKEQKYEPHHDCFFIAYPLSVWPGSVDLLGTGHKLPTLPWEAVSVRLWPFLLVVCPCKNQSRC